MANVKMQALESNLVGCEYERIFIVMLGLIVEVGKNR